MAEKELFIQTVRMVEVDGAWNIPTATLYEPDRVLIGYEALSNACDYKQVTAPVFSDSTASLPCYPFPRQIARSACIWHPYLAPRLQDLSFWFS